MSDTKIVIVTHGDAGASMLAAVERVVGKLDVETVSVPVGADRAEIEGRLARAVELLQSGEVLFLLDLEGSTPFNLCRTQVNSVVLTGMNMPMLLKLATVDRQKSAVTLAEELRATGMKSIHVIAGGQS